MTDIVLGIRLKADGSDLVGQVRVSEDALKKLRETVEKTTAATGNFDTQNQKVTTTLARHTSEAAKLNEESKRIGQSMSDNANRIGAYSAGWNLLTDNIVSAANAVKDYIKDSAMLAARYETLGVVMGVVGRNAGYSAAEMNAHAEAVRKSGISMNESREVVIKLAQAQIDLSLASKLARAAQDAAVIGNMNSTEALERMTHGIVSGQTEILRAIGINVNFEDSYKKMAKQIGVTTEQLTEQEKVQARANVVLEYSVRLQGTYEAAMGTAAKQINSLKRYEEDLKTLRGEVWNEALVIAVDKYTGSLKGANEEARKLSHEGKLKEWGDDVVDVMAFVADAVNGVITLFKVAAGGLSTVMAGGVAAAKIANAANPARGGALWNAGEIKDAWDEYRAVAGMAGEDERRLLMAPGYRDQVAARRAGRPAAAQEAALNAQDDANEMAMGRMMFGPDYRPGVRGAPTRPTGGSRAGAADGAGSFYAQTMRSLENRIDKLTDGELTEFDKLMRAIAASTHTFTIEQMAAMGAAAGTADVLIREKNALKAMQEELQRSSQFKAEAESITAAYNARILATGNALDDAIKNIEFETEMIGKNSVEREKAIALRKLEASSGLLGESGTAQFRERIEQAYGAKAAAEKAYEAQKQAAEESKRLIDDTGRGITDAIMRGGADGWKSLRDTFVNGFKNMVLRPIIQPIITSAAGAVGGLLGLPGIASASGGATGGLGSLGGIGNLLSGGGSIMNFLGADGGGIAGLANGIFQNAGVSMGSQFIADIGNFGFGAPVIGGLMGLATGNIKGGIASAALGTIGNLIVPGIGGVIGSAVGGLLGGGKKKTPAVLTSKDMPGGYADYASGLGGAVMGNDANQGYRWQGETWSNVFTTEIRGVYDEIERLGKLLGRDTSGLRGIGATITTGGFMQPAEILPTVLDQLGKTLAQNLIPNFDQLAQAGESVTQTLTRLAQAERESLTSARSQLIAGIPGLMNDISGQLGVTGLRGFKDSLSVSEYVSPLDRFGAARGLLSSTYSSAMGGDLTAVNAFPQILQQALGIGRDVYASGPEFQSLFLEGNRQLNELLSKQQSLQTELFAELPITIQEASQNQITVMREQTKAVVDRLKAIEDRLRLMEAA
jgi:hypothetical protein